MLPYPDVSPVAFKLFDKDIYWYGLSYFLGIVIGWMLTQLRARKYETSWSFEEVNFLCVFLIIGVVIGGRVGNLIFYDWDNFSWSFEYLFNFRKGGRSFHGALLGVLFFISLFAYLFKKPVLRCYDILAVVATPGIALGRLGNFINGELWGRPTTMPWGMVFPRADSLVRHPSQLYEMLLEGIILFIVVWLYASKKRPAGCVFAVGIIGYAFARIFVEFFRQPEANNYFSWVTSGQLLSLPMLVVGIVILFMQRE